MVMQSHPHDVPLAEEVGGANRDARSHVRDTATMWKKVLRSDETQIELFGLNAKHYLGQKLALHITLNTPSPLSTVKYAMGVLLFSRKREDDQS